MIHLVVALLTMTRPAALPVALDGNRALIVLENIEFANIVCTQPVVHEAADGYFIARCESEPSRALQPASVAPPGELTSPDSRFLATAGRMFVLEDEGMHQCTRPVERIVHFGAMEADFDYCGLDVDDSDTAQSPKRKRSARDAFVVQNAAWSIAAEVDLAGCAEGFFAPVFALEPDAAGLLRELPVPADLAAKAALAFRKSSSSRAIQRQYRRAQRAGDNEGTGTPVGDARHWTEFTPREQRADPIVVKGYGVPGEQPRFLSAAAWTGFNYAQFAAAHVELFEVRHGLLTDAIRRNPPPLTDGWPSRGRAQPIILLLQTKRGNVSLIATESSVAWLDGRQWRAVTSAPTECGGD